MTIIADTGILVAYLDSSDTHHKWACETMSQLTTPFVTCEAVLAEVVFLLMRGKINTNFVMALLDRGIATLPWQASSSIKEIEVLLKRYADVPMSFADACLVRMSEEITDCRIWTTDSDFRIYRRNRRNVIPLIAPW